MTLGIYTSADDTTVLSTDSEFTHPFAVTFDGRTGGYKEIQLFVRNNDTTKFYSGVTLSLEDTTPKNITTNTAEGFAWKLSAGDTKPTLNDWLNTAAGNTIALDNIGATGDPDISTFLPFWIFIEIPQGLSVQLFTDVKFVLAGDENLV